jgi:hypothetical protein
MLFLSLPSTGTGKGTSMLTGHFRNPRTLDRIQSTAAAPYLDVFADALTKAGYKRTTIQRYLGAAAHLSFWQQSRARLLTELDGSNVGEFKQHLLACKCVGFRRVNELDAPRRTPVPTTPSKIESNCNGNCHTYAVTVRRILRLDAAIPWHARRNTQHVPTDHP